MLHIYSCNNHQSSADSQYRYKEYGGGGKMTFNSLEKLQEHNRKKHGK
jgi:hypothetical protein